MRVHDALRPPGRAAGVVDGDRVVLRLEPVLGLAVARSREERFVCAAVADEENALDRGVVDEVGQRRVYDEHSRPGMPEDVADLVAGQPGVDRDQHGACSRDAVMRLEQLRRVERQEGDAITFLDAAVLESDGQPASPLA